MAFVYVPYDGPIVTRAEAKAAGLKRYFTGIPCKRGHFSQKYFPGNNCIACKTEREQAFSPEDQALLRAYNKVWRLRQANPAISDDQILLQDPGNIFLLKQKREAEEFAAWRLAREAEFGRKIHTFEEAKALGLVRYFAGIPCPNGHLDDRYVSVGNCVTCSRSSTAAWSDANPGKAKAACDAWLAANLEHDKARRADYYQRNKPERLANGRAYYAENAADRAVTVMAWRTANPLVCRAIKQNYRAKLAAGGTHTAADIAWILETQKGRCAHAWCRVSLKKKYHIDHIIPLFLGGTNDRKNLQALCAKCNLQKNKKHPIDFAQQNGMLL